MYLGIIAVFWMMAITGVSARQAEDEAVTTMDQVVVSVTQTETTSAKIGGNSVTVITAKEIEEKIPIPCWSFSKPCPVCL